MQLGPWLKIFYVGTFVLESVSEVLAGPEVFGGPASPIYTVDHSDF